MKANELRSKNSKDLYGELHALLKEQFNLRMQQGLRETPKAHNFKLVRKNIARIKTVLREKNKQEQNHE